MMEQYKQYKDTMKGRTNPPTIDPVLIFETDKLLNQTGDDRMGDDRMGDNEAINKQAGFDKENAPPNVEKGIL